MSGRIITSRMKTCHLCGSKDHVGAAHKCETCNKFGHIKENCPDKQVHQQIVNQSQNNTSKRVL